MINLLISNSSAVLSNLIEKDPNMIIGAISAFLGYILNFIFNIVYNFTADNSMGISIIIFTIVARTLMLPLAFKQQKSMVVMRKIQPEMEKIKAKYEGNKDPEVQKKMNVEIQALYAKNKANPFAGCLPMLITLPIFFALSALMRQSYIYVDVLGDIYEKISVLLGGIPGAYEVSIPIIREKLVNGMTINFDLASDLSKALSKFTVTEWNNLIAGLQSISPEPANEVANLFIQKQQIESFIGLDLISATGWSFPGLIIPILTGITTFLSTWIMNRQQAVSSNPAMKSQQNILLIVMPVMMTWMTTSLSAGVGIYWIVSSVYQTIQQILLNKYYTKNDSDLIPAESGKQPKEIIVVDKSRNKKKGER